MPQCRGGATAVPRNGCGAISDDGTSISRNRCCSASKMSCKKFSLLLPRNVLIGNHGPVSPAPEN